MAFKWDDSYQVNILEIDKQHKRLFEIGNAVYEIAVLKNDFSNSDNYDEIIEVLEQLKDYTKYHFSFEENIMKKYDFDQYETHKIEHDFFIKKLDRISKKDIDSEQNKATVEILDFLSNWISGHILNTDTNYIGFFKEKGI